MKLFIAALILLTFVPATAGVTSAGGLKEATPWLARYHGETIDLRDGWGAARACTSDGITTSCFDSEREMDRFLGHGVLGVALSIIGSLVPLSACSSDLRLYSGISYTVSVLNLSAEGVFINLSAYSFDNITSSYKVGACDTAFYDGASGSGSVYPGNTAAGALSASMATGWNDRIGSVYIA